MTFKGLKRNAYFLLRGQFGLYQKKAIAPNKNAVSIDPNSLAETPLTIEDWREVITGLEVNDHPVYKELKNAR